MVEPMAKEMQDQKKIAQDQDGINHQFNGERLKYCLYFPFHWSTSIKSSRPHLVIIFLNAPGAGIAPFLTRGSPDVMLGCSTKGCGRHGVLSRGVPLLQG